MADKTQLTPDKPAFQPGSYDPDSNTLQYESRSIWWWDNGIWGKAGYAIPNDGGKPTSGNETIRKTVKFLGRELFNLMHRPDVQFSRPFNSAWLYDLHKMLRLGIKRMADQNVDWTDERDGDADHATNTTQSFVVYPVPYFGERIRQEDARTWCGQVLLLLSECMQHSDNDYHDNVTSMFTSRVQRALLRIRNDMAMKYLGFSREEVEAEGFDIPDTAFSDATYKPDQLFTSSEMVEERMPDNWWPTTNDLTPIAGIPIIAANVYKSTWPDQVYNGDGGAIEAAWPGGGINIIPVPGSKP